MEGKLIPSLIDALDGYKSGNVAEEVLCSKFDELSKSLAADAEFRQNMPIACPSLWSYLLDLWTAMASGPDGAISRELTLSLARFTRNLVADVPRNQAAAFVNEPMIRGLLHRLSSFSYIRDDKLNPLARMLVQTLSNLVTLNVTLAKRLWTLYTTLPEEQNIVIRLLASPDARTIVSVLVLVLNCVKTDDAGPEKLSSQIGLRIVVILLDRTELWVEEDAEESEPFTLAYRIFEALLDRHLGNTLFYSLSVEDEPITPHQTTFLKIMDSYLRHQSERRNSESDERNLSFLAKAFSDLSVYCCRAIQQFLGQGPTANPGSTTEARSSDGSTAPDIRLPKVSAALVLLSNSLTTICLQYPLHAGCKDVVMAIRAEGFVEILVDALRLIDRFLPRIVHGQSATQFGGQSYHHTTGSTSFNYLKRDLVRLLGTICNEQKDIQDRIRECGGIQVVMNLCVIDERNPYLQEHALFALRNILHDNVENQHVINVMNEL